MSCFFVEYAPADLGLFSGIDIRGSVFNICIALAKKAKRPRINEGVCAVSGEEEKKGFMDWYFRSNLLMRILIG
jgi:hypothetical protein